MRGVEESRRLFVLFSRLFSSCMLAGVYLVNTLGMFCI